MDDLVCTEVELKNPKAEKMPHLLYLLMGKQVYLSDGFVGTKQSINKEGDEIYKHHRLAKAQSS